MHIQAWKPQYAAGVGELCDEGASGIMCRRCEMFGCKSRNVITCKHVCVCKTGALGRDEKSSRDECVSPYSKLHVESCRHRWHNSGRSFAMVTVRA